MFNQDAFGGPLIYRLWPKLDAYVDDRSAVVYGEEFMMRDYRWSPGYASTGDALAWHPRRHDRDRGDADRDREPAAGVPGWTIDYADDRNVIFSRVGSPPPSGTPPT